MVRQIERIEKILVALEPIQQQAHHEDYPLIALTYWASGKSVDMTMFTRIHKQIDEHEGYFSSMRRNNHMITTLLTTLFSNPMSSCDDVTDILDCARGMQRLVSGKSSMMDLFRSITIENQEGPMTTPDKIKIVKRQHPILADANAQPFLEMTGMDEEALDNAQLIYEGLRKHHFQSCKGLLWLAIMLSRLESDVPTTVDVCTSLEKSLSDHGIGISADDYVLLGYMMTEIEDMQGLINEAAKLVPLLLRQRDFQEVSVECVLLFVSAWYGWQSKDKPSNEEIYRLIAVMHQLMLNDQRQLTAMAAL